MVEEAKEILIDVNESKEDISWLCDIRTDPHTPPSFWLQMKDDEFTKTIDRGYLNTHQVQRLWKRMKRRTEAPRYIDIYIKAGNNDTRPE